MTTPKDHVPFATPDIGPAEVAAATDAIASGWLTTGAIVGHFEQEFAAAIAPDVTAVAVNSATAGMHLALEALGIGAGDEVLVPTWTFTATAEVVRYLGATPVLVDIDARTRNIDLDHAATKISKLTRAIMPVHFAGLPANYEELAAFAKRFNLAVVEDAAHAFPAASRGINVGAGQADATVFSFYATKTITTGEGGMVVTRDATLAARMRTMRLHGIDRDVFDRYQSKVPAWRYDVVAAGYKYNLPDPAAAIGRVQLSRAADMRAKREQIAEYYNREFSTLDVATPENGHETDRHAWHLYVLDLRGHGRDRFIERMSEEGIGCSVHFIPLHQFTYWRDTYGLSDKDYPVASGIANSVVSLPLYSAMSNSTVTRVADTVRRLLG